MSARLSGLIISEIRRSLSRRIIRLFGALAVLGILIAVVAVSVQSEKPSAAATAELRAYEAAVQACIDGTTGLPEEFGRPLEIPPNEREDFCRYSGFIQGPSRETFSYANMDGVVLGTSVPLIILSFLLGASLIGAEWRAGTITTMLTWESNRLRLFVTKLIVAVAVCVGFALAVQALLLLAMLPVAAIRGSTVGVDGAFLGSLFGGLGRATLMFAVASAIGFAIGATGRNTAAALGVGFVYVAVIEGFLTGFLPWFRPWSMVGNAIIWVSGEGSREIIGRSVGAAGFLLAAYAAGVSALATAIFRARDVT
ncbi:MAG TPA: ABC transporter permease [Actinomycetota bacterium]